MVMLCPVLNLFQDYFSIQRLENHEKAKALDAETSSA